MRHAYPWIRYGRNDRIKTGPLCLPQAWTLAALAVCCRRRRHRAAAGASRPPCRRRRPPPPGPWTVRQHRARSSGELRRDSPPSFAARHRRRQLQDPALAQTTRSDCGLKDLSTDQGMGSETDPSPASQPCSQERHPAAAGRAGGDSGGGEPRRRRRQRRRLVLGALTAPGAAVSFCRQLKPLVVPMPGLQRAVPPFVSASKPCGFVPSNLWRRLMPSQCWLQLRRLAPPEQRQALDAAAVAAVGSVTAAAAYYISQGSSA